MFLAGIFSNCVVFCLMVIFLESSFGEEDIWVTWVNNGSVCVNDHVILRCNYDQKLRTDGQSPDWMINGNPVNFASSDHNSLDLAELKFRVTTSQPMIVLCSVLIYDENNKPSGRAKSESVTVVPKDLPEPEKPSGYGMLGTDRVMLLVNHRNVCFDSHTFFPEVSVNGDIINGHDFKFNEMIEIPFDVLHQGTAYEVDVTAVCQNNKSIRSEPWTYTGTIPPTGILSDLVY
jgi:hypothetical protein